MILDEKNFFIKKGYRPREANLTHDDNRDFSYWAGRKIEGSKYYNYDVYRVAHRLAKRNGVRSVIDVGCGPAIKLAKWFSEPSWELHGIDQPSIIKFCKVHFPYIHFFADDFEKIKSKQDRVYDMVICSEVIEHLVNPDILLNYIKRISNKDTWIVISTPERDILRGKDCMSSDKPEHVREWNRPELQAYLQNRGFQIVETHITKCIRLFPARFVMDELIGRLKKRKPVWCTQTVVCKLV